MIFQHTIQTAAALNARILDDSGQPVRALIMPVVVLSFWLPSWLYVAAAALARAAGPRLAWWLDGPAWLEAGRLCWEAMGLSGEMQ